MANASSGDTLAISLTIPTRSTSRCIKAPDFAYESFDLVIVVRRTPRGEWGDSGLRRRSDGTPRPTRMSSVTGDLLAAPPTRPADRPRPAPHCAQRGRHLFQLRTLPFAFAIGCDSKLWGKPSGDCRSRPHGPQLRWRSLRLFPHLAQRVSQPCLVPPRQG